MDIEYKLIELLKSLMKVDIYCETAPNYNLFSRNCHLSSYDLLYFVDRIENYFNISIPVSFLCSIDSYTIKDLSGIILCLKSENRLKEVNSHEKIG